MRFSKNWKLWPPKLKVVSSKNATFNFHLFFKVLKKDFYGPLGFNFLSLFMKVCVKVYKVYASCYAFCFDELLCGNVYWKRMDCLTSTCAVFSPALAGVNTDSSSRKLSGLIFPFLVWLLDKVFHFIPIYHQIELHVQLHALIKCTFLEWYSNQVHSIVFLTICMQTFIFYYFFHSWVYNLQFWKTQHPCIQIKIWMYAQHQ